MSREINNKYALSIGTDPEVFIGRNLGRRFAAVDSRTVVPPDGLELPSYRNYHSKVVRDGVQAELQVGGAAYGCRQALASAISQHLGLLNTAIAKYNSDGRRKGSRPLVLSFRPLVKLHKRDITKMDADSLILNCRESHNAYGREPIKRDGATYPYRSGSGHIHLGTKLVKDVDPNLVVKILDVIVGIPSVLIARDPGEAIRRETYGRAGEYRLPRHGLEYRVPSNFWLRDYKLQSMVFGLAKLGHAIAGTQSKGHRDKDVSEGLLERVEKIGWDVVERAINTNDRDLALRIYTKAIKPTVKGIHPYQGFGEGLMEPFEYFIETLHTKGIETWFTVDDASVMGRWNPATFNRGTGWERFLTEIVAPRLRMSNFTGIVLAPEPKASRRRSGSVAKIEQIHAGDLRVAA